MAATFLSSFLLLGAGFSSSEESESLSLESEEASFLAAGFSSSDSLESELSSASDSEDSLEEEGSGVGAFLDFLDFFSTFSTTFLAVFSATALGFSEVLLTRSVLEDFFSLTGATTLVLLSLPIIAEGL